MRRADRGQRHEKIREELLYVPAKLYVREFVAEVVKFTEYWNDESRDAELPDINRRISLLSTIW